MKIILSFLILVSCSSALAFTNPALGIYRSDGTAEDTQAAADAAADNSTIEIPAGHYSWEKGVSSGNKALHFRGAGAGTIVGHSETPCLIAKGIRAFQIQPGLGFREGQLVRVIYSPHGERFMEGLVSSYKGMTLEVDVSTTSGEGACASWCFATPAETTITNNLREGSALCLEQSGTGLCELSGIHFVAGKGNTVATNHVAIQEHPGGRSFRIHHCRFSTNGDIGKAIEVQTLGGLIDNCSFDQGFDAGPGNGIGNDDQAIGFKAVQEARSWRTASTMGALDREGTENTYVEDCYFVGFWTQCLDFDDNSRTVVRRCIFNNCGSTSHGADTSPAGNRHFEVYDNEFLFTDVHSDSFNVTWLLFLRGGTGVITDNIMPNLRSQFWGDKAEFQFTVMNLHRNAGPHPCWKSGWPAPHQIGQGHDGKEEVLEPVYIWGNSGGVDEVPYVSTYYNNECGGDAPKSESYLQEGRDFIVGTPKPGYAKFRYPHPLRD